MKSGLWGTWSRELGVAVCFLGVCESSSRPRPPSGILPTAHPVGEGAVFFVFFPSSFFFFFLGAGATRPHQTMAFCCKQSQRRLPGAPSLPSSSLKAPGSSPACLPASPDCLSNKSTLQLRWPFHSPPPPHHPPTQH